MAWPLFYDPGEPARWPGALYDGYFDRVIEDSQSLNKIAHVELYPKHLSWSDAWYWLVDGYNTFMNAIQPDRKILKTTLLFSVVYIYYEGIIQNKTNNIKKIMDAFLNIFEIEDHKYVVVLILSIVIIVLGFASINKL